MDIFFFLVHLSFVFIILHFNSFIYLADDSIFSFINLTPKNSYRFSFGRTSFLLKMKIIIILQNMEKVYKKRKSKTTKIYFLFVCFFFLTACRGEENIKIFLIPNEILIFMEILYGIFLFMEIP